MTGCGYYLCIGFAADRASSVLSASLSAGSRGIHYPCAVAVAYHGDSCDILLISADSAVMRLTALLGAGSRFIYCPLCRINVA